MKICKRNHERDDCLTRCPKCQVLKQRRAYKSGKFKAYMLARYAANPQKQIDYSKAYNKAHPEKHSALQVLHQKRHPGRARARILKYKLAKINRTPKWLTADHLKEIQKIYMSRSKNQHVDHVIPLRGKIVSGLHVPWNLQILDGTKNCSKGNRMEMVG